MKCSKCRKDLRLLLVHSESTIFEFLSGDTFTGRTSSQAGYAIECVSCRQGYRFDYAALIEFNEIKLTGLISDDEEFQERFRTDQFAERL